jgi:hypothetical protein
MFTLLCTNFSLFYFTGLQEFSTGDLDVEWSKSAGCVAGDCIAWPTRALGEFGGGDDRGQSGVELVCVEHEGRSSGCGIRRGVGADARSEDFGSTEDGNDDGADDGCVEGRIFASNGG